MKVFSDPDVLSLTVDVVRKKLGSIISQPRVLSIDSNTLSQLEMLDQKLSIFPNILDKIKMGKVGLLLEEMKFIIHQIEDFVEEVECEMFLSTSQDVTGTSSNEDAVHSPNQTELNMSELYGKQSGANRKRKCAYAEDFQEIIGKVDVMVGRAEEVSTVDLSSGNQSCKRGKAMHEGSTSKTCGEFAISFPDEMGLDENEIREGGMSETRGEFAMSFPDEMDLDENEVDSKQSVANHRRKCGADVQDIIGKFDSTADRAKGVLLVDLPSGNQTHKLGNRIHEGTISKNAGKVSDQTRGLSLKHVTAVGSNRAITQEAKELGNFVDEIIKDFEAVKLQDTSSERFRFERYTTSFVIESSTFGRSKDVKNVLRMLFSENGPSRSGISVLAITGMGGIGKTTLAQLVYNHPKVNDHFDLKGWVSVLDDFNVVKLTRVLIESFTPRQCHLSELGSLQSELSHLVMGKSFFLVLDDVWNENLSLWNDLIYPLRSARYGQIIVTTRNMRVARMVQTMSTYSLGSLSYEDSFSLFTHCAFSAEINESNAPDNLRNIAIEMVKRCRGLPLVVKIIGSMLRHNLDIKFWKEIMNEEWGDYENEYLLVLKISYDRLPPVLKLFFTMFSLYPKGYIFSMKDVTKLWLALDYAELENNEQPEVIVNNYFKDLVQRNLIEQHQYYETRRKGFIMHDLVHDLAQNLAGTEFIRAEPGQQNHHAKYCRYISIIANDLPQAINLQPLQECHQLRLLQIINKANKWNNCIRIDLSDGQLQYLSHLRILDLRCTKLEALPSFVGSLKQLRYLNLTNTNISKLPESLSYLRYLKILELKGCPLRELPKGITNLVNLRHLNFFEKNTCIPQGIGRLTNLQTLPVFCIKRGSWHCEISELKELVYLRGELTITGMRNVSSAKDAELANLQSKSMLEVLTIDWSNATHTDCDHYKVSSSGGTNSDREQQHDLVLGNIETVFENLRPHVGLKELNIIDYFGSRFPKWFGDVSFSQLSKISLNGCGENCEVLPTLGLLPSLKSLYISWMYKIQCIRREFCSPNTETKGFQSLEVLDFKYMPNWVQWSGVENGEFCRLTALRIVCCNELQFLPQMLSSSLTRLLINNCKELSMLPFLPSLTRLTLSGDLSDSLLSNLQLPSLQFLKIACTDNITSLSLNGQKVPALMVLVIKGCKYLQAIAGISSITSLKKLEIIRCCSVQISSSEEIPPSLRQLTIIRCHWLEEWHQVMISKYREQLLRDEGCDYDMVVEETEECDEVMMSTNDFVMQESSRTIEEQPTAEWRKGKSLELGESSCRN